ncbi:MAG TPA: transcription elongation factor GreA [Fimbriimonadales bacterium]|nr:transcription elongation factor GreA [Fimbriimonadales bacterium]
MPLNEDAIYLTPSGYSKLKEELERLSTFERRQIAERIRESMEHGEYSEENTELDEVKFEQAVVENRIEELKSILANAHVLEPSEVSTKVVSVGTKVTLKNRRSRKEVTVTIVSSAEADLNANYVSDESPLGMALIGKQKGDIVTVETPSGKVTYEILKIGKAVK